MKVLANNFYSMFRRVEPEIKDKIIQRIKTEGLSVKQAAAELNVSDKAIYRWIGAKGTVEPGLVEMNGLKREVAELKQIIGSLTLTMERGKKN